MRIDAHNHFWQYDPTRHVWIDDEMAVIKRDFLPHHLQPLLKENSIDGCIAVQADQTKQETDFLLHLAHQHNFIQGVVGWIDFTAEDVEEQLSRYQSANLLKGFRHIVQDEEPGFLNQSSFLRGIRHLEATPFTYDILIYPHQLSEAIAFVKQFPQQVFIIDHLAKPTISKGVDDVWVQQMNQMAAFDNVYCKVSGLVTETDSFEWQPSDFIPFLDVVSRAFGVERLLFGSDWPVCLLAATYEEVMEIITDYYSQDEQALIFSKNTMTCYALS